MPVDSVTFKRFNQSIKIKFLTNRNILIKHSDMAQVSTMKQLMVERVTKVDLNSLLFVVVFNVLETRLGRFKICSVNI